MVHPGWLRRSRPRCVGGVLASQADTGPTRAGRTGRVVRSAHCSREGRVVYSVVMRRASRSPYFMTAFALIGIADAFYVAQASYTGRPLWCAILEGCNTVLQSPYARLFGVQASYVGLVFYLHMFGLGALLALDPFSRGLRVGALVYTAAGMCYSGYFAYLQVVAIRAPCLYCIISAVLTVLLFIAALRHFSATRMPATTGHA